MVPRLTFVALCAVIGACASAQPSGRSTSATARVAGQTALGDTLRYGPGIVGIRESYIGVYLREPASAALIRITSDGSRSLVAQQAMRAGPNGVMIPPRQQSFQVNTAPSSSGPATPLETGAVYRECLRNSGQRERQSGVAVGDTGKAGKDPQHAGPAYPPAGTDCAWAMTPTAPVRQSAPPRRLAPPDRERLLLVVGPAGTDLETLAQQYVLAIVIRVFEAMPRALMPVTLTAPQPFAAYVAPR